ncbi:hypothetical protein LEN26_006667 [Aphanomyces euteiches]|nr:hypothetical protein AeMF1_010810 [Aphanomyces euteiches]KAH9134905.1 hypothetical protein LEN26_006667 [Aphanomyces euteiches]
MDTTKAWRVGMTLAYAIFMWRSAVHTISKDIQKAAHALPNLLTPADGSFAIWGIVYTWMLVFLVKEWIRPSDSLPRIQALYGFFLVSSIGSTLWMEMFVAGYTSWSFVPIFVSWLALFGAYLYVEDNIEPILITSILASSNAGHVFPSTSRVDFWCIRVPFTIYWAWVCAASTIALNILIENWGIHEMAIYIFWCGMWVLANSIILIGTGDVPFACVALWTLLGIASKNRTDKWIYVSSDVVRYGEHYALEVMATVGAFVFGGLFCFLVVHKWWRGPSLSLSNSLPVPTTYGATSSSDAC